MILFCSIFPVKRDLYRSVSTIISTIKVFKFDKFLPWMPEVIFFFREIERKICGGAASARREEKNNFFLLGASRLADAPPPRISHSISRKKITSGTQDSKFHTVSLKSVLCTDMFAIFSFYL